MNLMELIKTRRSIRKYEKKEVSKEDIIKLMEAVRWSPSWANTQCWEVIVVSDAKIKENITGAIGPKNPGTNAIVNSPVLFVLCAKLKSSGYYKSEVTTKFGDWFMYDLGIATQNLILAAHELGIGTLIMGHFDHNEVKKMVGVPEGYEVVSLICAGYPAQSPKPPKRKEVDEFIHYEHF